MVPFLLHSQLFCFVPDLVSESRLFGLSICKHIQQIQRVKSVFSFGNMSFQLKTFLVQIIFAQALFSVAPFWSKCYLLTVR